LPSKADSKTVRAPRIVNRFKHHVVIGTLLGLLMLYTVYELVSGVFVYSRDAYITTDVIGVAPQVSGPLSILAIRDSQVVQQGDLLIKIDPEPFQLDLDRLQANLELARATEERAKEEVSMAADRIASQQAQLDDAKVAFERAADLRKLGNIAQQAFDDARRTFDVATALLRAAQASRVTAEREVFVQAASVTGARAAVARAKYNLECTVLVAPVTGRVAPLIVRVGDYLTAGRPVVAIVSDENWRLVVNLPERHLKGLKVGQRVYCYIHSDPWRIHAGKVRSVAPGVARSLDPSQILPYVNLTTDWIRLPRRFPVEIDLGELPKKQRLFVGGDADVFYVLPP
jgi:membrane fusion protein, multidrug efflux system